MKSIVLLKITSGRVNEVHDRLRQMQTVKEWRSSFGRYEAAAVLQADSLEDLWQLLEYDIRPICGVIGVFPCLIPDDRSLEDPPDHVREFVGMAI